MKTVTIEPFEASLAEDVEIGYDNLEFVEDVGDGAERYELYNYTVDKYLLK